MMYIIRSVFAAYLTGCIVSAQQQEGQGHAEFNAPLIRPHHEQQCGGAEPGEEPPPPPPPKHFNVILIGATGDLAKKYLWGALFDLFSKHYIKGKTAFSIYGCARTAANEGRQAMSQIMLDVVQCGADTECRTLKTAFVSATQYHQLKDEKHYEALASKITENTQTMYGLQGGDWTSEEGRLFYLSIPPSAYTKTVKLIHKHLRPKLSNPWVRLVLEKPFGHDKESAAKLAERLQKYFKEEEIYRIDHYLGKAAVKAILPFREKNAGVYEALWNREHVARVEIAMKETLDVRGRTGFYEETGVMRDVMQNHLTEILALVAMELPGSASTINRIITHKVQLLKSVQKLDVSNVVIGQYHEYPAEVQIELNRTDDVTNTATFSAAALSINNARWKGVPFVLMSGKKLDEKASYVRIIFKESKVCLHKDSTNCNDKNQIVFNIANGDSKKPVMVFASSSLPKIKPTFGWKRANLDSDISIFGESVKEGQILVPDSSVPDAYSVLLGAVFEGQRHMFTSHPILTASWNIWSDVIHKINQSYPRPYEGQGRDSELLDFIIEGNRLNFANDAKYERIVLDETPSFGNIPSDFLGNKLISYGTAELIARLAKDMHAAAKEAIASHGTFHVAFSGGQSPRILLRHLSTNFPLFPWEVTHIWLVDERCVDFSSDGSNLKMIDDELLRHIEIPLRNVHAMPVQLAGDFCDINESGPRIYEAHIHKHVKNDSFDFVLLGVGMDAHTASLFPNQPELHSSDLVALAQLPESVHVKEKLRMTLTFRTINQAKYVAVLVTGKIKHDVLVKISKCDDLEACPILGVKANRTEWYIDHDALFS